jgi:hypothetical protein
VRYSEEIEALQRQLEDLAASPDDATLGPYRMQRPQRPPGLYWQLRWLAGRTLRLLESIGLRRTDSWPVRLKHAAGSGDATPLLIWAIGIDTQLLRESCDHISEILSTMPEYAPVLITDVADFAFFSRLGWLVEYVPSLAGEGESFAIRKSRFLARLYQGAPVLPASTIAAAGVQPAQLRQWIIRQ